MKIQSIFTLMFLVQTLKVIVIAV